jgi:hypothetical protein
MQSSRLLTVFNKPHKPRPPTSIVRERLVLVEVVESSNVADVTAKSGNVDTVGEASFRGETQYVVHTSSKSGKTSETPKGDDAVSNNGIKSSLEDEDANKILGKNVSRPDGLSASSSQDELIESGSGSLLKEGVSPRGKDSGSTLAVSSPGGAGLLEEGKEDVMSPDSPESGVNFPESPDSGGPEWQHLILPASREEKEPLLQRRTSSTYKEGKPEPLFQRRT